MEHKSPHKKSQNESFLHRSRLFIHKYVLLLGKSVWIQERLICIVCYKSVGFVCSLGIVMLIQYRGSLD